MAGPITSRDALELLGVKPMQLYHWASLLGITREIGRGRRAVYTRKDVFLLLLCRRLYEELGLELREAVRVCDCVKGKLRTREHLIAKSPLHLIRVAWEAPRTAKKVEARSDYALRVELVERSNARTRALGSREYAVIYVRVDDLLAVLSRHE